jgi:tRNA (guanine6-N2)-methyltransferase
MPRHKPAPDRQRPFDRRHESLPAQFELEVIPGLEGIATHESRRILRRVTHEPIVREGLIPIAYDGDPADLLDLRTALSASAVIHFDVPRPKALLGQQAFDRLMAAIEDVRALHPPDAFTTFRVSAAGQDSAVMRRLRDELALRTGLEDVEEEGDLLVRVRRPLDRREGWEVLIRLSPRPLSARSWRVCNLPGAINASVAHAMALVSRPHADDAVLNLMCGSATLLIERLMAAPARIAVGCDTDAEARSCAIENLAAADLTQVRIEDWNAGDLPTPDSWADVVLADLPFGQLVGSHEQNIELYPRVLREAARVTIAGGLFVAITHEIRLWERLVDESPDWTIDTVLPIKLPFGGGHLRPRIYVMRRA